MTPLYVFAQLKEPVFVLSELRTRAERFFNAKVGLKEEPTAPNPLALSASWIVLEGGREPAICFCSGAKATPADYAQMMCDQAATENGLLALGKRCEVVFRVERASANERAPLLFAAILASVHLGPIVDGARVYGVKTAREALSRLP